MNCGNNTCPLLGASLIPLTKNKYAIVDIEDYGWLSQWKWRAMKDKRTFYAVRHTPHPTNKGKKTSLLMHRLILNVPKGMQTDHRYHNGLDNRKQNISICTHDQNNYNRQPYIGCSSKYKGVHRHRNSWSVGITYQRKHIHIGVFKNEAKAAKAYDKKAKELFGEFACLNFPE